MNKEQVEGRIDETKSKAGDVMDYSELEVEGSIQKNVGEVENGFLACDDSEIDAM